MTERQRELHELLALPDALLSRKDLAELGLPRRAVDAVFRALGVVALPGYGRRRTISGTGGSRCSISQAFRGRGSGNTSVSRISR